MGCDCDRAEPGERVKRRRAEVGWVEDRAGVNWKITPAGRKAAGRAAAKAGAAE